MKLLLLCCAGVALWAAEGKLALERQTVYAVEGGPGVPRDYEFQPGETVYFDARAIGFSSTEKDLVHLSWRIEVRDKDGNLLKPPDSGQLTAELADEDKKWRPRMHTTVSVPPLAETGDYQITVTVKDELNGQEARSSTSFHVRGPAVTLSDKLSIQNFRFLRTEDDREPLAVPAYRGGDAVWIRFEITGFKLERENRYQVQYGVSVQRANGDVTFSKPDAATAADAPFYPQRLVPGIFSLTLSKDMNKGEYTVTVMATDQVGNQHAEEKRTFTVE